MKVEIAPTHVPSLVVNLVALFFVLTGAVSMMSVAPWIGPRIVVPWQTPTYCGSVTVNDALLVAVPPSVSLMVTVYV